MSIGNYRMTKEDLEKLQEHITDKIFNTWMNDDRRFDVVPSPVQIPLFDSLSKPIELQDEPDKQLIDNSAATRNVEVNISIPVNIKMRKIVLEGPADDEFWEELKDLINKRNTDTEDD
jgi:hypothetical protein